MVTRSIYRTYVLARLAYGLEALRLTPPQIDRLEKFHRFNLRLLQSLPDRVASSAVYLLIGLPPFEAILDMNIANLIGMIVNQESSTLHSVMQRQLSVKGLRSKSWFIYAAGRLAKYDLPSLRSLLESPPPLRVWKATAKKAILGHWTLRLQDDADTKPSIRYLRSRSCVLTEPHPVWKYSVSHPRQAVRACTKARLLTGTYTLQANRHRFNQHEVSAVCPTCGTGAENRLNFIRECRSYDQARATVDNQLTELVPGYLVMSQEARLQCILDPEPNVLDRARFELITARFLYSLHVLRTKRLREPA